MKSDAANLNDKISRGSETDAGNYPLSGKPRSTDTIGFSVGKSPKQSQANSECTARKAVVTYRQGWNYLLVFLTCLLGQVSYVVK